MSIARCFKCLESLSRIPLSDMRNRLGIKTRVVREEGDKKNIGVSDKSRF